MTERITALARIASVICCATLLLAGNVQAAGLTSADTNHDGKISHAEAQAAQDKAFKHMDKNGDGRIDVEEFDTGQPGLSDSADARDKKRRQRVIGHWFKHMDADGNNRISRSEYRKALAPYFDRLDTNDDGYISSDELKKAFGEAKSSGAQPQ